MHLYGVYYFQENAICSMIRFFSKEFQKKCSSSATGPGIMSPAEPPQIGN